MGELDNYTHTTITPNTIYGWTSHFNRIPLNCPTSSMKMPWTILQTTLTTWINFIYEKEIHHLETVYKRNGR